MIIIFTISIVSAMIVYMVKTKREMSKQQIKRWILED